MAGNNQEFDVKIMLQSWEKAIEVKAVLESKKIKINQEELKDIAITFFVSSIENIREHRKEKTKFSQY